MYGDRAAEEDGAMLSTIAPKRAKVGVSPPDRPPPAESVRRRHLRPYAPHSDTLCCISMVLGCIELAKLTRSQIAGRPAHARGGPYIQQQLKNQWGIDVFFVMLTNQWDKSIDFHDVPVTNGMLSFIVNTLYFHLLQALGGRRPCTLEPGLWTLALGPERLDSCVGCSWGV